SASTERTREAQAPPAPSGGCDPPNAWHSCCSLRSEMCHFRTVVLAMALLSGCGSADSPVAPTLDAGVEAANDSEASVEANDSEASVDAPSNSEASVEAATDSAPDGNDAAPTCTGLQPHCGPCD